VHHLFSAVKPKKDSANVPLQAMLTTSHGGFVHQRRKGACEARAARTHQLKSHHLLPVSLGIEAKKLQAEFCSLL